MSDLPSGYLEKRGQGNKAWQKRYVTQAPSFLRMYSSDFSHPCSWFSFADDSIEYRKSAFDSSPRGRIELQGCTITITDVSDSRDLRHSSLLVRAMVAPSFVRVGCMLLLIPLY
jgi:hypothetical protein